VVEPVQVLVEAYAGTKQSQDLATATFIGHPASRLPLLRRVAPIRERGR